METCKTDGFMLTKRGGGDTIYFNADQLFYEFHAGVPT